METTDQTVLRVLAGQHASYLIKPEATAFAVEGLAPADVLAALQRLEAAGYAREDEIVAMVYATAPVLDADGNPVLDADGNPLTEQTQELVEAKDADGNPVVLDTGWTCTDAGHADAVKHAAVPDPVQLAGVLYAAIASAQDFDEAKANLAAVAHVMGASDPH